MIHTHRYTLALLIALLFGSGAVAQTQTEAPKTLTLVTYNMENVFDVFDDPYHPDEGTRVKPREEYEQIAALLKKLDADVIACQEIENEGVLKAFVREFLPNMGYRYVAAAASNDGRGIRTAIISRLPIVSITSYRFLDLKLEGDDRTWQFARDLMHVKLQATKDRTLDAFIVHLKSKRGEAGDPQSGKWRLAEATMAKGIIDAELAKNPDAWLLITGDFNDTPDAPPIQKLLEKTGDGPDAKAALTDLHAHIPQDKRITYLKKPYRSTIDYVLVSSQLANRVVKDSAIIVGPEDELKGSDHAPVLVKFDLSK
ncbi:MAG: endonuclease/exonuclease/phosphatase family protein [Phycisphaeraceae bacterium]